ncbi:MAG: L-2-amino-thiazoline-4-carboxylic acid hydrolase [Candidatus Saliniplasma sp.]
MAANNDKMNITYEAYFRSIFGTIVEMFGLLEEEVGREEALKRISKFSDEKSVENRKRIIESKDIQNFEDFKKVYKEELSSPPLKDCLSYEVKKDSDTRFKFDVHRCLWAEIFKQLDASDIGYEVSCKPDLEVAPIYHPNVELKRTKTLMQGDDHCDFEYIWKDD